MHGNSNITLIVTALPLQQLFRERASILTSVYWLFYFACKPRRLAVSVQPAVTGYTQHSWTPALYPPVGSLESAHVIVAARPIQLPVYYRKLFVQRRWGTATGRWSRALTAIWISVSRKHGDYLHVRYTLSVHCQIRSSGGFSCIS